jgi:hypothetical protein
MKMQPLITGAAAAALAVACAAAAATPAGAAVRAAAAAPVLPTSTSWPTPQTGMTLTYPALKAGAKPSLLLTTNSGRTWSHLSPPPVAFPSDQDQPQLAWGGDVIAVTNGTSVVTSQTKGQHWSADHLTGITVTSGAKLAISGLAVTQGRIVAVVTQRKGSKSSTTLYSAAASGASMSPVPGLSVSGSGTYGFLSTQGGLQVAFGVGYTSEHYWYLRGSTFTSAPLPCPASDAAAPGGVAGGKPVVLCSEPPSTVAPGATMAQISIAPRLGGTFKAAGKNSQVPNPLGFAAASNTAMTLAASPGLGATFNAGGSWTPTVKDPEGSFWNSLAFPTATVGVATATTVNSSGQLVGYLYRTTNAGHHWTTVALP